DLTMSRSYNPFDEDEDDDFKRAQATVDSSNRSLFLLNESEKVGVETAEELMRQGEQDMKTSQRHINSIKNMFSGFTNYFRAAELASNASAPSSGYQHKKKVLRNYHQKVDNLDDMSLGLGRLKNLALGLQSEIDEQDDIKRDSFYISISNTCATTIYVAVIDPFLPSKKI
uniref:Uncharacterized protein n=1 Tax=Leptobrachium leishanense TaxID=445787 RepID=A0A8C5M1V0_9ANUR